MKTDLTNLFIWAVLGAGLMHYWDNRTAPPITDRYKLVRLGDARRDTFLLDTAKGNVWTVVCEPGDDSLLPSIAGFKQLSRTDIK